MFYSTCKNCGKEIEQSDKGREKYFCSDKCRYTWWTAHPEARSPNSEAFYTITCAYCGKLFNSYGNSQRKYCCHEHYIALRFNNKPSSYTTVNKREDVLKLYAEGHGYKSIAKLQGISVYTIKNWIRKYSDVYPRNVNYESEYHVLNTVEENICEEPDFGAIELCTLQETGIQKIFLICGPLLFQGKIDAFIARVPQMLEYNLNIGDVFVFCSRGKRQLSILQWQGLEFALMFRRTEKERYPFPNSDVIRVVEITKSDLNALIDYPKFLLRLSGVQTPQILV